MLILIKRSVILLWFHRGMTSSEKFWLLFFFFFWWPMDFYHLHGTCIFSGVCSCVCSVTSSTQRILWQWLSAKTILTSQGLKLKSSMGETCVDLGVRWLGGPCSAVCLLASPLISDGSMPAPAEVPSVEFVMTCSKGLECFQERKKRLLGNSCLENSPPPFFSYVKTWKANGRFVM